MRNLLKEETPRHLFLDSEEHIGYRCLENNFKNIEISVTHPHLKCNFKITEDSYTIKNPCQLYAVTLWILVTNFTDVIYTNNLIIKN